MRLCWLSTTPEVVYNIMTRATCRRLFLAVFVLWAAQFLVVMPFVNFLLPFSPYSHYFQITSNKTASLETAIYLNQERVKQAKRYFQVQNRQEFYRYYTSLQDSGSIYMSVAIVTVNRSRGIAKKERLGYLFQSAAALDRFAKSTPFINRTFVFVCNVDKKPKTHQDTRFLKAYLPFAERYGSSSFRASSLHLPGTNITYRQKKHKSTYDKETFDYMYCLKVAKSMNPKYTLIVEDDAVAHKDLSQVLKHFLDNQLSTPDKAFAFLKLYYPIRWQGFSFEILSILELLSMGTVGGGLGVLFLYIFSIKWARKPSLRTYRSYFLASMVLLIVTAEMVGRQNLMEIRRVSKYMYQFRSSPGCCTQAMLYPVYIIDSLLNHLISVPFALHTDLAIQKFVHKTCIPAYFLEPNLFYHVGMFTSLKSKAKNPNEFIFDM